ncbi:MAG: bifunctional hydroxymethylpyrimidine kinase/phosphomethylpyrimidine kinase [Lentisphaeria bacterium]|nr:bifunctional hydroxymethylpyrimidine kinase/phosphomethylpyrimidine kinase [Lentisphaeria bacterium]
MQKKNKIKFYPAAMTVSGSDSGGTSGIAADLRTFNAFGVFGSCAITAISAQNPYFIRHTDVTAPRSLAAQIETVREKIHFEYMKTGFFGSAENISAVVQAVKKHAFSLVCAPEFFTADGKKTADEKNIPLMESELFVLAQWLVADMAETELLCQNKCTNEEEMVQNAKTLSEKYHCSVIICGEEKFDDIIVKDGKCYSAYVTEDFTPLPLAGAKSTYAAALTAMLALDFPWKQAVCSAKAFVFGSLCQSVEAGPGCSVMYPPAEDYSHLVKLAEAE